MERIECVNKRLETRVLRKYRDDKPQRHYRIEQDSDQRHPGFIVG